MVRCALLNPPLPPPLVLNTPLCCSPEEMDIVRFEGKPVELLKIDCLLLREYTLEENAPAGKLNLRDNLTLCLTEFLTVCSKSFVLCQGNTLLNSMKSIH